MQGTETYYDVRTVNPDSLTEIRGVKIDPTLPPEERIRTFREQMGDPCCFRCGQLVIKLSFADTCATMEDRLLELLRGQGG